MSDIDLIEPPVRATPASTARGRSRPMRAFPVIPAVRARLAAATRGGAVRPAAALASDNEDALGAARGIVFGLLLVTPFWAALGSSLWLLLG